MTTKSIYFILITFLCFALAPTNEILGQNEDIFDYSATADYEIGGLKVNGAKFSDENAIISITGLRVGDKIKIPGTDIPGAIKALWKLRLFTDIEIIEEKKIGDVIFLQINVKELPRFSRHAFKGVRKGYHDDMNDIVNKYLLKGGIVTENVKTNVSNALEEFFVEKGYLDAQVEAKEFADEKAQNAVRIDFVIERNQRIKIQDITFVGNSFVQSKKLRRKMKETRRRRRIFSPSKLIQSDYKMDKENIVAYYNTIGFRDAAIKKDSIWRNDAGRLMLQLDVQEGNQYYFRDIKWKGNSIYETKTLANVLGINNGDVYNQELLETRLRFSQDGRDISTLYMDNGYLFFQVEPIEVSVDNDSIDLEIRIYEGPQAEIDKVVITGNDRTHEHVIRRELRTRPGQKFSRSDIIRSQREIVNLGYFNPETLGINTPVNPQAGTVDIEYQVEEKPSDQLELSAGWGGAGRGVIGTLGVTFNNFSIRNFFNKETWSPLPQGDGQRLSLRAQTNGRFFQSYNISFTEPWLGGKKPNSLTVGGYYTILTNGLERGTDNFNSLGIAAFTIGLGSRLKFPDDNFISNTTLSIQNLALNSWETNDFVDDSGTPIEDGSFNNISINQTFTRTSVNDPIFPRSGSSFSLSAQFTLPYSLFKSRDYDALTTEEEFRWLEYHKWRFTAQWYTSLVGNLVLKAQAKIGLLGKYNSNAGLSPFERYVVGGDGLANQQSGLLGYDLISLRGYDVEDLPFSDNGGAAVFDKFTVELRYPISLNPSSTIYVLAFAEGGNSWSGIKNFNPFDVKRSTGMGLRVFLPMFGTLGFDYGIGFDKPELIKNDASKFSDYGRFSIILGFEPE